MGSATVLAGLFLDGCFAIEPRPSRRHRRGAPYPARREVLCTELPL